MADLVLIDDGLVSGGGQLGLGRYLRQPSELQRTLVLLAPNPVADAARAGDVPVVELQRRRTRAGLPAAWLRLLARHARRGTETVVANSLMAAIVLAATPKRGRQFVYYLREDFSPDWITGIKRQIVQRLVFPRYDGFLANSAWTGSTLPPGRHGPRRVEVAYPLSGVTAGASPAPDAADELRVLSLSRIARWKGIDLVVDAAIRLALHRPVRLTVAGGVAAGDEDYADELRRRDTPAGLRLDFIGHVEDVDALLAEHDVLVVASRHPEPFGQVVVQALAWGLTVVASDQGGPADVLAGEPLGRLVTPDDAAAIASTLAALADDPPSAEVRAEAAQRARRRYGDPALAAEFEAALQATLS